MEDVDNITEEDRKKWEGQATALEQHLRSMANLKRKSTPFPKDAGTHGTMGDLFERAQCACAGILQAWTASSWLLGVQLWQVLQNLANEASTHAKTRETGS